MAKIIAKSKIQQVTIEAVVIRADGTREDLGVIASYKKPLRKRITLYIKDILNRFKKE
jgi:hypothetical protein